MEKFYFGMGVPSQQIPILIRETVSHEQDDLEDPTSFEIDQLLVCTAIRREEMFCNQLTESIFDEEEDRTMHESIQMIPF